jgi:hypothetical protein
MREGRLARPGGQNSSAAVATRGGMTCCAFGCSCATLQAGAGQHSEVRHNRWQEHQLKVADNSVWYD